METKTIQLEIPEYLTIGQYQKLPEQDLDNPLDYYLGTISAITGIDVEEIGYWDLDSIKKAAGLIKNVSSPNNEFHSILEWNGKLYGYANIHNQRFGEYYDLERLCKDVKKNLHSIAAILYRPIEDHDFGTIEFELRQSLKMVKNKVENVFDFYTLEKYNNKIRKKREKEFKDFPVHVILGALSFFLTNANQYLTTTAFLEKKINKEMMMSIDKITREDLLANIGAGGGLFTHSLKPIYYQFQGKTLL